MSLLKVMTLNIGNPSLQRVQKQIDWLETTVVSLKAVVDELSLGKIKLVKEKIERHKE